MSSRINAPDKLVELRFLRQSGVTSFLVVVPDDALKSLNANSPSRALTIAFNGVGRKSKRLAALADAVKEFEDAGAVKIERETWRLRALRAVSGWFTCVALAVSSWVKAQREGGAS